MVMKSSTSEGGRQSASALRKETRKEERKVEERKGSALSKGAERVEERSRSSDGKSAGQKQH
nr:hypothetical protein [Rhizobium tibeticum]